MTADVSTSTATAGTDRLNLKLPASALDQVPLGIARIDRHGRIVYANAPLQQFAGLDLSAGVSIRDLFRGNDLRRVLEGLERRLRHHEGGDYEVTLTRPDGKAVPISITSFPEADADGRIEGALTLVRDLTVERAIEQMVKHLEGISDTHALLDAIGDTLMPLVPFDLMRVLRLNQSGTHLRTIYESAGAPLNEYRWWPIPLALRPMLESDAPILIDDMRAWYQDQRAEGLAADVAIEAFIDDGFTSTLTMPVLQNNRQVASLVLARKTAAPFTTAESKIAERLPLTEAVSVAQRNDTERNHRFLLDLVRDIAAAYRSVRDVAATVVERIQQHHGWESVSIHQFDPQRQAIHLLARHDEYAVTGNDGDEDSSAVRSILRVPIGGNSGMLLCAQDSRREAFCPEDEDDLKRIATSLDALLKRALEYNYRTAIIGSAKDAIFLVKDRHLVFDANDAAAELLQLPIDRIEGRPIADLFIDPEHARMLLDSQTCSSHDTAMKRHDGDRIVPIRVLLSVAALPAETPGHVFIASDLTPFVRGDELEIARAMLREITSQVKTPMSLAMSWLRRLSEQAKQVIDDAMEDVPEKVLQQLRKAELTLDRMLFIEQRDESASSQPTMLAITDLVRRSLDELPALEMLQVDLSVDTDGARVWADPYELRYGIQTVLTYLLRTGSGGSRIAVRMRHVDGGMAIDIDGPKAAPADDSLDTMVRGSQVAAELALGQRKLQAIAQRNGGRFEDASDDGQYRFRFWYPIAQDGESA